MAQINVIGYVTQDIILKQSREGNAYAHFVLKEYISKSRYQAYQVWAWDNVASMLQRLRIKKRQPDLGLRLFRVSRSYRKGWTAN